MKIWNNYTSIVRQNSLISSEENKDLKYWRDDMFSNTIIYVIPLSIITLIPSLIWAFEAKLYSMFIIDILSVVLVIFMGIKKGIKIKKRKLLFIGTSYVLSSFLVYYVGLNSTLYLLAACFLATFIYTFKNQYTPAIINVYISILYISLYYLDLAPLHNINFKSSELFAIFSNLIFLSFLVCSLVPKLFNGLDESFKKSIQHTNEIEIQNKILKEITWIQSHVVRTPLSRIMAITNLLKENDNTEEEKTFLIDNIIVSSKELDEIIQEIVSKSENIRFTENENNNVE
jgi:signal transduction histidine kinase